MIERRHAPPVYCLEFVGEDDPLATLEAAAAGAGVRLLGPGLGIATSIDPDRARTLAFTRRACELVGRTDASVRSARALLETAPLERSGSVAVRATDVRGSAEMNTRAAERELGDMLVDRGFSVELEDPDHELRAYFASGPIARDPAAAPEDALDPIASGAVALADDATDERSVTDPVDLCVLGWTAVESRRDFGERAPTDRPFFQPGSMDPMLARGIVNLAGADPGRTVFDPMCGTGGLLAEATLVDADVIGLDAQEKMTVGARENLRSIAAPEQWAILRGDAARPPLSEESVDTVVFDAPYERQSPVSGRGLDDLVANTLDASRSLAPRAVIVADRPRVESARAADWTVRTVVRRRVHGSLTRHIHVLEDESG
jgi:tRNA (guanine10-N2)-dimethyltransferase